MPNDKIIDILSGPGIDPPLTPEQADKVGLLIELYTFHNRKKASSESKPKEWLKEDKGKSLLRRAANLARDLRKFFDAVEDLSNGDSEE